MDMRNPGDKMGTSTRSKPVNYHPKKLYSFMLQQQKEQERLQQQREGQQPQPKPQAEDKEIMPSSPAFTEPGPTSSQWCSSLSPNMLLSQSDDIHELHQGSPYMSPATKRIIAEKNLALFDGAEGGDYIDECLKETSAGKNIDLLSKEIDLDEQIIIPSPSGSMDSGMNEQSEMLLKNANDISAQNSLKRRGPRHRGKSDKHLRMLQSMQNDLDIDNPSDYVGSHAEETLPSSDLGGKKMSNYEAHMHAEQSTSASDLRRKPLHPSEMKTPNINFTKEETELKPTRREGRSLRGGRKSQGFEDHDVGECKQDHSMSATHTKAVVRESSQSDDISESPMSAPSSYRRRRSSGGRGVSSSSSSQGDSLRGSGQYDMCNEVSSSSTSPNAPVTQNQCKAASTEMRAPEKASSSGRRKKMKIEADWKDVFTNSSTPAAVTASDTCQVCGDIAAGFHCGAYVCEACKKFFVRCLKQEMGERFVCSRNKGCTINKETRTQCQYCRYRKCLSLGMYKPGSGPGGKMAAEISNIPCKVCESPSSGYHFGAITCEGCKGFFRRTVKERAGIRYVCSRKGACTITTNTRNICKYCRYQKCLQAGMTPDGSRIGRQPNSVKHATMLELQRIHCGETSTDPQLSQIKQEISTPPQQILPEDAEFELVDPSKVFDSDLQIAQNVACELKSQAQQSAVRGQHDQQQTPCSGPHLAHQEEREGTLEVRHQSAELKSTHQEFVTGERLAKICVDSREKDPKEFNKRCSEISSTGENIKDQASPRGCQKDFRTNVDTRVLDGVHSDTYRQSTFVNTDQKVYNRDKLFVGTETNMHPIMYEFNKPTWSDTMGPGVVSEQGVKHNQIVRQSGVSMGTANVSQEIKQLTETNVHRGMCQPRLIDHAAASEHMSSTQEDISERAKAESMLGLEREMFEKSHYEYLRYEESRKEYERIRNERLRRERMLQESQQEYPKFDGQGNDVFIRARFQMDFGKLYEANVEAMKQSPPDGESSSLKVPEYAQGHVSFGTSTEEPTISPPIERVQSHTYGPPPPDPHKPVDYLPASTASNQSIPEYEENIPKNLSLPKLKTLSSDNTDGLIRRTDEELNEITTIIQKSLPLLRPISHRSEGCIVLEEHMTLSELWSAQMAQFGQSGPSVIKFAKKVPGFQKFPLEIQISKVQMSMYPVVLCVLSQQYDTETETYNYFNMTNVERDVIFSRFPSFRILGDHLHHVGHSVQYKNLDEVEIGYLCALFLLTSTATSEEKDSIAPQSEADLIAALQQYCSSTYPEDTSRVGYILVRIAELNKCNLRHHKAVLELQMKHPELEMPRLFMETYLNI